MNATCKFCDFVSEGADSTETRLWNKPLFESNNFVVVPTVGSIVPGWLLLVPRRHFLCFGALNEDLFREMSELRHLASTALQECFGRVATFEHGPNRSATSVGCGVDHAHLHLVSTEIDLVQGIKQTAPDTTAWDRVEGIESAADLWRKQQSYLFVETSDGQAWLGTHSEIGSQLFRKVIAGASGCANKFDWKSHSFAENVRTTVDGIEAWKQTRFVTCV